MGRRSNRLPFYVYLNTFHRTVINKRAFREFGTFKVASRRFGKVDVGYPRRRVPPNMFKDIFRGFTTTFSGIDTFGQDNIRFDDSVLVLL